MRAAPTGVFAPHAEQRLRALQARAGDIPEPEWPAPESLWTQLVPLSLEDTVAHLVQKAHAEGAFFGMVTLPDGVLRDVMARDAETLQRLGLGHAQIADALDRLLAEALRASEDRIARATDQFEEELQASGMRGVPGLAVLPLGISLDDLEKRLRDGGRMPAKRGTAVDDHDVFLQIYLGYPYCPFTRLRLPWSDDVPELEVVRRRVKGVVHLTAPTDRCLPCRSELSYRYGNLEFLIVHRDTRRFLRGSGLLVHLIRDHRFFEGEESPFRLDPERAAHVLGLSS